MIDILDAANVLAKINVKKTLVKVLNKSSVEKFIVSLNTDVQLVEQGVNSDNVLLSSIGGNYKPSTMKRSRTPKKSPSIINLKDSGDYHKTFHLIINGDSSFSISSDPMKDGVSLFKRWGDVDGLTTENEEVALSFLEDEFYKEVFKGL